MAKVTKERWHARGYSYEAGVTFKKCLYLVVVQIKRCRIIQEKWSNNNNNNNNNNYNNGATYLHCIINR